MKLLILTPIYPPQTGGAAQYYSLLSQQLLKSKKIEKIIIISSWHFRAPWRQTQSGLTVYRLLWPYGSGRASLVGIVGFLLRQLQLVFILFWLALLRRPDIVQVHCTFLKIGGRRTNHFFYYLLRLFPAKIVLDIRDLAALPSSDKGFSALICASQNILRKARQLNFTEARLHQIPIPLEIGAIATTLEQADLKPFLLFVGDIQRQKGALELLKAFEILKSRQFQPRLIFIGRNLLGKGFLKLTGKDDQVIYLGPRPRAEVLGFIQSAELLVLPSYSEGMPRVVLESLALKKKVLFPAGIPELERACPEFVLSKTDPKFIAQKIKAVLAKEPECHYSLTQHNPKQVAQQTLKVFNQVLDK